MHVDAITWALAALAVVVIARQLVAARSRISGADARAKVAAGALLLDVRTEGEFRAGSLPGAQNVPVASLGARLGELDKARPVVVFCASGIRSASASATLRRAGFAEVHDLGPASAW